MLSTLKLTAIGAVLVLQWVVLMAPVFATETTVTPLKMTEVYPDAPGSAELGHEYIELVNTSATAINLENYQLQVKGSPSKKMRLSGEIAPAQYLAFTTTFTLLNSGDTIQLVFFPSPDDEVLIEEVAYTKTTDDTWSWSYFDEGWEQTPLTPGEPNKRLVEPVIDVCPLTEAIDEVVPEGYVLNEQGECVEETVVADCQAVITEISAQNNLSGKEYVEFYNPTDQSIPLSDCVVQINGKPAKTLPVEQLPPEHYYVWEQSSGTLANSGGVVVLQGVGLERVYEYGTTLLGEVYNYNPGTVLGVRSGIPTPGEPNQETPDAGPGKRAGGGTTTLADCGPGRYRSPETNRCRTSETAVATLATCAADQERNPETNRCRKVSSATTAALTPCKEGQERNPATNRCRQIASAAGSLKPCAAGQERNPETNRCRKVAATGNIGSPLTGAEEVAATSSKRYTLPLAVGVGVACVGYGMYEYRSELTKLLAKLRWVPRHSRPPD